MLVYIYIYIYVLYTYVYEGTFFDGTKRTK